LIQRWLKNGGSKNLRRMIQLYDGMMAV